MDDLDHSMHIAESDWMSFYKESEECGLLQPLLACPDDSSLSDSEDSGNSSSVFSIAQNQNQNPAANSDEAKSNVVGCCMEDVQINHSVSGKPDTLQTNAEKDRHICVKSDTWIDHPGGNGFYTEEMHMRTAEHITTVTKDDITTSLRTVQQNILSLDRQSTELTKQYGDVQAESHPSFMHEHDHHSGNQTEVNEPHRDTAVSKDVDSGTLKGEKERWFLTQQWMRAVSVKDKQRPKKTCKSNHMCQTLGQEESCEKGLKLEKNNEAEGGRDTQSNQNSRYCAEENPESFQMGIMSDLSQISSTSEDGNSLSGKQVTSLIIEPTVDRNKQDPRLTSTSQDALKASDPSLMDGVESDEFGDSAEFLSIHSWDSDSYLSASESVEDTQHPLMENQQLQSSSSVAENGPPLHLTENTDAENTRDRHTLSPYNSLSCNVTTSCEIGDVQHTVTFPSAAQSVQAMPDGNASCDRDTNCLQLCMDAPGLQTHGINLSAPGCSLGDETLTPHSVASSPETYAVAAGQTRPVYAISAFWDDMEKLTINDILQLRTCRETTFTDTQETVTRLVETVPTNHSPLVDTVEYNLTDAAAMDTADTTGSDYCSQLDESKPHRSSCEFSTSDFEEYWQFLGARQESSSDPQRTIVSPFFVHEEEESTARDGLEAPVPSKECFEYHDSDASFSSTAACPTQITKSRSVWNVQALNTEDLCVLGNADSSLYLSSCPSLEENVLLRRSPSLGTLIPAHCLSNTTRCVSVYDPDAISVAPLFRCTLCAFKDETSFSFLHDQCSEKTIPIFCCSHPTVRDLTLSYQDHVLRAYCEDDISPIKYGALSFIQASECRMSAAGLRGFCTLKGLLPRRRISFHDKGSIWCRGSGAWVFPLETEKHMTIRPSIRLVTEEKGSSTPKLCGEVIVQQRLLETIQTTRQDGIFSTLKQSDMCLVCIAFASWVLRSSDPEAADAWKAVLLANVSALSAIQYLRHYVKKNPSQDDP